MEVRVTKIEETGDLKIIVTPYQYCVLKNSLEKYNKQRETARKCNRRTQEREAAKTGKKLKPFVPEAINRIILVEDFVSSPSTSYKPPSDEE